MNTANFANTNGNVAFYSDKIRANRDQIAAEKTLNSENFANTNANFASNSAKI